MERVNFVYSIKNISIPRNNEYIRRLVEKTELFIKRLRWKALFFLNPDASASLRQTYGFKTPLCPPGIPELANFEHDLQQLNADVQFKPVKCAFQSKLASDINKTRHSDKVTIAADKTNNFYRMSPNSYNKLLTENITAKYKQADVNNVKSINEEAKQVAEN